MVSALRQFSAPVKLEAGAPPEDDYVLLAGDPDLFNRWEAGQRLARTLILGRASGAPDEAGEARFAAALGVRSAISRRSSPSRPCCSPCRANRTSASR